MLILKKKKKFVEEWKINGLMYSRVLTPKKLKIYSSDTMPMSTIYLATMWDDQQYRTASFDI